MVFGLGRGGGQPAAPAMGGGVTSPQLDAATAEVSIHLEGGHRRLTAEVQC